MSNTIPSSTHSHLKLTIVLLLLFSFSLGEVYRHLLVILSIFGLFLWIKHHEILNQQPVIRLFIILFLCLWAPMLVSLIDAEYIERSASVTARFLIFPLAGIVLLYWILQPNMAKNLLWGTLGIVLFWIIDGLVQFTLGHDILGRQTYSDGRLSGTFDWPHLGVILAIFLPVYLEGLYQLSLKSRWSWLLILPVFAIILLGGGRSSWMLTIVSLACYFICFHRLGRSFSWRRGILLGVISAIFVSVIIWNVDWLSRRVNNTLGLFSGEYTLIDRATSMRPSVWSTALNMSSEHWLNGVGPRAFQSSYQEYSTVPDDSFIDTPAGHPHLFVLEVTAETGLLGLTGYIVFSIILIRKIQRAIKSQYSDAIPWGLSAMVAAFPLSSTMSFYAYFSSCLMWTLIIIFIALSNPLANPLSLPAQRVIASSKHTAKSVKH